MKNKNISNDSRILKHNHIASPYLSKMMFRAYDPKMKTMVFFTTLERKQSYLERQEMPEVKPIGRNYKKSKYEKDHSDRD